MLGLNLVPSGTLQQEASWYAQQEQPYGIPLDIRHTYTKADWEMWTAASTDDLALRQNIVDALYDFVNTTRPRCIHLIGMIRAGFEPVRARDIAGHLSNHRNR
jgi:Domain of unknown function (DUF1793)